VFIENVGNLICPALFDLGERARVVILSVTEGEDKRSSIRTCFGLVS
jgi:hydrogenase nickel incorporation protein HypB